MRRILGTLLFSVALLAACSSTKPAATVTPLPSAPASPTTAPTQPTTVPSPTPTPGVAPIDYTNPANWLCRPGKTGTPCTDNLEATFLGSDGTRRVDRFTPAADPPIDCFYIYPTVSTDPGLNSDMIPGDGETRAAINQAARFGSLCKVYAPTYRQVTLTALNSGRFADPTATAIAYGDVANAWHEYLANDNHGRGVVLISHSQGTRHAKELITAEIDTDAHERSLLVSAILLGGDVHVPAGKDVGGDFQDVPACRKPDQTGCVVAYSSFASASPPPANSLFARGAVLCNNPAALSGVESALLSYFPATGTLAVSTPFVEYDGFRGQCVSAGGFSYLKITSPPGLDFPGPAITALGPQWGLHIVDSNLTLGNQLALVATETAAYLKR
jgi:Protein of unknown function (DUF3089)